MFCDVVSGVQATVTAWIIDRDSLLQLESSGNIEKNYEVPGTEHQMHTYISQSRHLEMSSLPLFPVGSDTLPLCVSLEVEERSRCRAR